MRESVCESVHKKPPSHHGPSHMGTGSTSGQQPVAYSSIAINLRRKVLGR